MPPVATVYLATNTLNGHQYVGVTRFPFEQRWSQHKTKAREMYQSYLYAALRKYGDEAFAVEAVASCLIGGPEASAVERDIIKRLRPVYNQTNGGEFTTGRKVSPEVAARIAAKNRGKKRTAAHKAANSAQAKARWASDLRYREIALAAAAKGRAAVDRDKQKRSTGESAKNRVWTSEMRAKLSASCMGRRYGQEIIDRMRRSKERAVLCVETQTVYPSMLAAAAATGLSVTSVSRVSLGKRNSANGLTFRLVPTTKWMKGKHLHE